LNFPTEQVFLYGDSFGDSASNGVAPGFRLLVRIRA
jgi:hypothetical protein